MKGIKICEDLPLEVQSELYCLGSTKRSYWRSVGWTEEHVHVRKSREAWEICQSRTGRDQRSQSFISIFWCLWNNFVSVLCGLKVWRTTRLPFFVVSAGQHQSYAELHPRAQSVPLQRTNEVPEQSASISQESKNLANEIRNWLQQIWLDDMFYLFNIHIE